MIMITVQILDGNLEELADRADDWAQFLRNRLEAQAEAYCPGEEIDVQVDVQYRMSGATRSPWVDYDGDEMPEGFMDLQHDLYNIIDQAGEEWYGALEHEDMATE